MDSSELKQLLKDMSLFDSVSAGDNDRSAIGTIRVDGTVLLRVRVEAGIILDVRGEHSTFRDWEEWDRRRILAHSAAIDDMEWLCHVILDMVINMERLLAFRRITDQTIRFVENMTDWTWDATDTGLTLSNQDQVILLDVLDNMLIIHRPEPTPVSFDQPHHQPDMRMVLQLLKETMTEEPVR
ncbi:hypothetical protein [Bifidobacterium sp. SO1]|uniref:hypothetical protein n=1 Tax=Bifidobacterium sp. SO1 TaxID=2809029 RepID=UPI001BDCD7EA|nr:hypothetical protein [Bifidobacterium sp. SO1]MBT1162174.1 hypothetical protein [Bifidobacterium sp. SO1]